MINESIVSLISWFWNFKLIYAVNFMRQFGGEFGLHCLRSKADPEGNLSSIVFVSGRTGENLMPSPPPFASAELSLEPAAANSPCRAPLDPGRYPAATAAFSDQKLIFVCVGEFHHCLY